MHDTDGLLVRMLDYADKTEDLALIAGDRNGVPFLVIVATGANVGLVKKYSEDGRLGIPDIRKATEASEHHSTD